MGISPEVHDTIPMIYPTDHKKFNKKEGPSEDASILLRTLNKIIIGRKGRERPRWKMGGRKIHVKLMSKI